MKYMLDTNACIRYLNGRSIILAHRLLSEPVSQIFVCSVVKAELFFGAAKSQMDEARFTRQMHFLNQFDSLPFDDDAARIYGQIRADLTRKGLIIGAYDLQIAAIALAADVTLVTHNIAEFGRIAGLSLEDWEI
jgi:tRNA(fMet)-specific endonuclease VapC